MKTFTFTLSFNVDLYFYDESRGLDEDDTILVAQATSSELTQAILPFCKICGTETDYGCGRCKSVAYCSEECQKIDWPTHKATCKMNAKMREALVNTTSNPRIPQIIIEHAIKSLIPGKLKRKIKWKWDNYKLMITATIKETSHDANEIADSVREYLDLIDLSDEDFVFVIKKLDDDDPFPHEIFTLLSLHDITFEENDKEEASKLGKRQSKKRQRRSLF
jgi:hypothetical protein